MIASVDGTVTVRGADHVVLECAGVGYRLGVSAQTLRRVPPVGENGGGDARTLARDGLVGLGYDPAEAQAMLDRIELGNGVDAPPEELIAAALRRSVKVEG